MVQTLRKITFVIHSVKLSQGKDSSVLDGNTCARIAIAFQYPEDTSAARPLDAPVL